MNKDLSYEEEQEYMKQRCDDSIKESANPSYHMLYDFLKTSEVNRISNYTVIYDMLINTMDADEGLGYYITKTRVSCWESIVWISNRPTTEVQFTYDYPRGDAKARLNALIRAYVECKTEIRRLLK